MKRFWVAVSMSSQLLKKFTIISCVLVEKCDPRVEIDNISRKRKWPSYLFSAFEFNEIDENRYFRLQCFRFNAAGNVFDVSVNITNGWYCLLQVKKQCYNWFGCSKWHASISLRFWRSNSNSNNFETSFICIFFLFRLERIMLLVPLGSLS